MKCGLLVYQTNSVSNIFNIGDYIQSLAARQFLKIDDIVYINREKLDQYEGEEVKMILNGWFMHSPDNWPPSKSILPLFVAFHLNSSVKEKLLENGNCINYFQKFQPIGCRDKYTVSLLQSKGIDAYFSGCLTLTLGLTYQINRKERTDKIYFVDTPTLTGLSVNCVCRVLYLLLFKYRKLKTIYKKRFDDFSIINYLRNLSFVEKYSRIFSIDVLEGAEYVQHEIQDNFNNDDEKFQYADTLLQKYARAKLVVTSRIHCALPCLGLETPVLYVYNAEQEETSTCRMEGLIELFHLIKVSRKSIKTSLEVDKIGSDIDFKNKEGYKVYRDELILKCKEFMNNEKE